MASDGRRTRAGVACTAAAALAIAGLGCRAPTGAGDAATVAAAEPPSGEAIFRRDCATCHLGRGGLMGNAPTPDLLAGPLARGDGAEALTAVIRDGTGSPRMPAFRDGLSDAEIAALVRWIREQRAHRDLTARRP